MYCFILGCFPKSKIFQNICIPKNVQSLSCVSDCLGPYRLQPTKILCPWDSPGKNTGVGFHFLLQGIFLTQGSNQCLWNLPHWQVDSLLLSHRGSPLFQSKGSTIFFFCKEPNNKYFRFCVLHTALTTQLFCHSSKAITHNI